jgi:bifunctional non-homologous end joining protein LigD
MFVWDTGTYDTEKWSDREVMVTFHGERVQGKYVLFQTRGNQWMIHRMDPPADPTRIAPPRELIPMMATPSKIAPGGDGWAFELKWDGVRAIAFIDGGRIRLASRKGNEITHRYPELRRLGEQLGTREVVFDGEIIATDDAGRPSFERLQSRMHVEGDAAIRRLVREVPVVYMLFDILWLDGHSLMELPYEVRRAQLTALALNGSAWQTPPNEVGDGAAMIDVSKRFELEGSGSIRATKRGSAHARG